MTIAAHCADSCTSKMNRANQICSLFYMRTLWLISTLVVSFFVVGNARAIVIVGAPGASVIAPDSSVHMTLPAPAGGNYDESYTFGQITYDPGVPGFYANATVAADSTVSVTAQQIDTATAYLRYYVALNGPDGLVPIIIKAGIAGGGSFGGYTDISDSSPNSTLNIQLSVGAYSASNSSSESVDATYLIPGNSIIEVLTYAVAGYQVAGLDVGSSYVNVDPSFTIAPDFSLASQYQLSYSAGMIPDPNGATVPEPGSLALMSLALLGVGFLKRKTA